ncbi:hypothetical protein [Streptomyces rimosus]|uniref:hypothetical protein n=1 Tax=Streptomyces rimosus TaxID=1927 RepID=UPI00131BC5B9
MRERARDTRTWSGRRGHREITRYPVAEKTTRSKAVSLYFQGMDGDQLANGDHRSVTCARSAARRSAALRAHPRR